MTREKCMRELGVMMSGDLTFVEHNKEAFESGWKTIGWVLNTFKTREARPVMTLFKELVLSRLLRRCVLVTPYRAGDIALPELV